MRRIFVALLSILLSALFFAGPALAAGPHAAVEQDLPFDPPPGSRSLAPSSVEQVAALQQKALMSISARDGSFSTAPVSALPQVVNGDFDGSGGWTQLQNDKPFNLVAATTNLGPVGVTTQPNLAWLGGGCGGCDPPTVAAVHRLFQTVQIPADYAVSLSMDYLIQSGETACGADSAGLYINNVLVTPHFALCDTAGVLTNTWLEATTSLAAFQGQAVTIEYRVVTDAALNSNFWLDNVQLCGQSLRLPLADQCPVGPWRETPTGSGRGGGVSTSTGRSLDPALAITGFNRPYLVWSDTTSGQAEIVSRRWNGEAWEAISADGTGGGNISNNGGQSSSPAIAADLSPERAGEAWVAWHDISVGQNEIYVRKWNNSQWVEAGAGSASGGGVSNTPGQSFGAAVAIGSDGLPWVAWTEDISGQDYEIYVRRWTGSAWGEAGGGSASGGGISNNSGDSDNVALAWSPNGFVYAAWADRSDGDSEIYVKRWKAGMGTWQEVGNGSASGGGISNNTSTSYAPSISIAADNTVFVAWIDRDATDTEIYLKRFTEVAGWQEVGANSASGGGISSNDGSSLDPVVAAGPDGRPNVAWSDLSGFNAEIFARRWNGSAWAAVGPYSAGYLGVSATWGFSATPTLAIGPDAVPWLAWSDNSTGNANPEVYLRRYVP